MKILNIDQLKELQSGSPFLGYPHYYLAKDCGVICPDCVKDNLEMIAEAMTEGWDDQWIVVACDINYEDDSLYCDNCNNRIISAYGDEEQ